MNSSPSNRNSIHGRGASTNPTNRFERISVERDPCDEDAVRPSTEIFEDDSQSIVTENNSPDVPFQFSINPYRGCEHGCAYCYARPTHEYLGWSAGIDFETKILAKTNAVPLLKKWLRKPNWNGQRLALSGVTDPYQPIERKLRITRSILELLWECRNPVTIITKNALVERDIDLLKSMAAEKLTSVAFSITTLNMQLARDLEPRCSTPEARLRAMEALSKAGIAVFASVAPIIPGLNDSEIPAILKAVSESGAVGAGMTMLRLPGAVESVFLDWLDQRLPVHKDRILSRIRSVRGGKYNQIEFRERMRGSGPIADQIVQTFQVFREKYGLNSRGIELDHTRFVPPRNDHGQLTLW